MSAAATATLESRDKINNGVMKRDLVTHLMLSCTWSIKASRASGCPGSCQDYGSWFRRQVSVVSGGIALFNWNDPNVTKAFHQSAEVRLIGEAPGLTGGNPV